MFVFFLHNRLRQLKIVHPLNVFPFSCFSYSLDRSTRPIFGSLLRLFFSLPFFQITRLVNTCIHLTVFSDVHASNFFWSFLIVTQVLYLVNQRKQKEKASLTLSPLEISLRLSLNSAAFTDYILSRFS